MVSTSIAARGQLTGSYTVETLYTATSDAEHIAVTFINVNATDCILRVYVNGATAPYLVINDRTMKESEIVIIELELGTTDNIRAAAENASSINYLVEAITR